MKSRRKFQVFFLSRYSCTGNERWTSATEVWLASSRVSSIRTGWVSPVPTQCVGRERGRIKNIYDSIHHLIDLPQHVQGYTVYIPCLASSHFCVCCDAGCISLSSCNTAILVLRRNEALLAFVSSMLKFTFRDISDYHIRWDSSVAIGTAVV